MAYTPSSLISVKSIDLLNLRIKQEQDSSRLYQQMSLWFDNKGYINLKTLYSKYAKEELEHAEWSITYLLNFGIIPTLRSLEAPVYIFENPLDIIKKTLAHEEFITKEINKVGEEAIKEKDFMLFDLILKYQREQQEEIGKAITLLDIASLTSDDLLLDTYISKLL